MNEITDQISAVQTPQEAVEQFVGEQYIEWLTEHIKHQMQDWPALRFLQNSELTPEKARKFLVQRFIAIQALIGGEGDPGFLTFAISNLSEANEPEAESPLEMLEKRLEDLKKPNSPLMVWKNLIKQLGASDDEIARTKAKDFTRTYIAELSDVYSTQEWQTALGAFVSQEWSLALEAPVWAQALKKSGFTATKELEGLSGFADPKSLLETGHLLDKIVFDSGDKQLIWTGVERQLELKKEFLDQLVKHFDN